MHEVFGVGLELFGFPWNFILFLPGSFVLKQAVRELQHENLQCIVEEYNLTIGN